MTNFVLDPSISTVGSYKVGDFTAAPADIVRVFGWPPITGECFKISGEYTFLGDDGSAFALYDWKETTQYLDDDGEVPSPDAFWRLKEPKEFSLGGHSDPSELIDWLKKELAKKDERSSRIPIYYAL